jgi:hypothetical protein
VVIRVQFAAGVFANLVQRAREENQAAHLQAGADGTLRRHAEEVRKLRMSWPGWSVRMRASPTSTAWAPAARTRAASARREDSALAHRDHVAGKQRDQAFAQPEVRFENCEVAIVDADDARPMGQRRASSSSSVWIS